MSTPEFEALNERASALMKHGIRLMEADELDRLDEAVECFGQALALRRQLPDTVPRYGFGLAACWLNLADALVRRGDPARLADALDAYDQGIAAVSRLPLAEDPRYPRRLAIGFQNRALALRGRGRESLGPATASFLDAVDVLEQDCSASIPDRSQLLATVWVNIADTHAPYASSSSSALAFNAVDRAIRLVADREDAEPEAATVGLKARHVRCLALAVALSSELPDEQRTALVHDATDAVDDALALVRRWEQKGIGAFRGLASDLVRFGARVYAQYQPQFLEEFITEQTDAAGSSPAFVECEEMRAAADEAWTLIAAPRSSSS